MAAPWVFLTEKISFSDHVLGFPFLQARMRAAAKARQRSDAELGIPMPVSLESLRERQQRLQESVSVKSQRHCYCRV
jgi:hypothetical protein